MFKNVLVSSLVSSCWLHVTTKEPVNVNVNQRSIRLLNTYVSHFRNAAVTTAPLPLAIPLFTHSHMPDLKTQPEIKGIPSSNSGTDRLCCHQMLPSNVQMHALSVAMRWVVRMLNIWWNLLGLSAMSVNQKLSAFQGPSLSPSSQSDVWCQTVMMEIEMVPETS
jgi:hypothetical protein